VTHVLVVDDVPTMAEQYAYDLKRVGAYVVTVASRGEQALDLLTREAIDCVVLDLEMPGMDGFDFLRRWKEQAIETPVIVYTGTGSYDRCIQAVRLGASGFIDKSEPIERVVQEVEGALSRSRMTKEIRSLRSRVEGDSALIGDSPPMRTLRAAIARVAPIPSSVLILGESGSGKELVARELHRLGPGGKAPFVAVNCAALPEQLVESELFGHERGAFTGADRLRRGAFETAGGGTLFLDEIGELPPPAQAKLLRVLEGRELTRVGGDRPIPVTARVVAATNRELEQEVAAGRFRQDLLFRLNVHLLRVPPLRDRPADLSVLTLHLLRTITSQLRVRPRTIAPDALTLLAQYHWAKNNVRELRNCLERMIIASDGDTITAGDVPPDIRGDNSSDDVADPDAPPGTFKALKAQAERRIIVEALEKHDWHITRTADALGLSDHASLLKIMRRHRITRPEA
jgi:two-component system, NtrC family, nitrogen regulation response regulator NtrX